MIENLNSKIKNSQIIDKNNDEIDLSLILKFLFRNKEFIGLISLITFISGIISSFILPKVWEGQFQIVLKKDDNTPSLNSKLASLTGVAILGENDLTTEVEILKSPSVLMPVFELAKSQNDQTQNKFSSFSNWKRNNLKILDYLKSINIDINEGMIVVFDKKMYFGSDAINIISILGKKVSFINDILKDPKLVRLICEYVDWKPYLDEKKK